MASLYTESAPEGLAALESIVAVYEHQVGHTCRAVASHLPSLLKQLPPKSRILDNACGIGAVTDELVKAYPDAEISAADIMPPMVDSFRSIIAASPLLKKRVKDLRIEDAQALTYPDNTFDASITNFGIFFFQDPVRSAKQIYRTLKPGGTAAVTSWKTFGFKPILREVQNRVQPINPIEELPLMEHWSNPTKLVGVLKAGGFSNVTVNIVEEGMWGQNKEDFKNVLLENFGALVARDWTEEEKAKLAPITSQVVDEMQDELCITRGQKVGCMMEAWVAIATK